MVESRPAVRVTSIVLICLGDPSPVSGGETLHLATELYSLIVTGFWVPPDSSTPIVGQLALLPSGPLNWRLASLNRTFLWNSIAPSPGVTSIVDGEGAAQHSWFGGVTVS